MRVVLTGGGTGGHVIPNFAVIEELKKVGKVELVYIGSIGGMEEKLVKDFGVDFVGVSCGKMRRYFAFKNFWDLFKFPVGIWQAYRELKKFKPDVVFAKGGYVSVPTVMAAHFLKIPIILHESDLIPGMSNKMMARYANKICLSFEESVKYFEDYKNKTVVTGNPVRESIADGDKKRGYKFSGLSEGKPVLLIMGGSQGAEQINNLVRAGLEELLGKFQIIHIRGKGNLDKSIKRKGYAQFEYVNEEMPDVYAISDIVISRGGANSLAEIAILKKKAVIIPLGKQSSRGDQIVNAEFFAKKFGWAVLYDDVSREDFVEAILLAGKGKTPNAEFTNGAKEIAELIIKIGK